MINQDDLVARLSKLCLVDRKPAVVAAAASAAASAATPPPPPPRGEGEDGRVWTRFAEQWERLCCKLAGGQSHLLLAGY